MEMKTHGGDIYTYEKAKGAIPIDFSANINPMGLPRGVKRILKNSIQRYEAYPDIDCNDLVNAISLYENVSGERILCGNGAADIIYRLCYAIRPGRALLTAPTFSEYETALKNVGCGISHFELKPETEFKISTEILDEINDAEIVFICNPNNPTGMLTDVELLYEIAAKCKKSNSYLIIDECFLDFMDKKENYSFTRYIDEFDNVLILKAFTKFFAMAGLRLGYCISSNPGLLRGIFEAGQPWSVSTPAQVAGVCALNDKEYIKKTGYNTAKEREYLSQKLRKLGFHVFESHANFILFKTPCQVDLYARLYEKGILIRKCENFKGLDKSYYRIAVKSRKDNDLLIKALSEIMDENKNG
jgi:threonine-phosphate decarboxylase